MQRLNLTLDDDTFRRLERHAKKHGSRRASAARDLIREALERQDRIERERKLAADYAAGRADAREVLRDLEGGQWGALSDGD
jgi:hypothetical protein